MDTQEESDTVVCHYVNQKPKGKLRENKKNEDAQKESEMGNPLPGPVSLWVPSVVPATAS